MPLYAPAKNAMLDHLAGLAVLASLHSADPTSAGLNELAGGSPAYARKPITWNPANNANLDNNANPVFDVGAGSTVAFFGLWSADGLTFYGSGELTPEDFSGQGTYTLNDADLTAVDF